jgi:hypothetical protein
MISLKVLTNGPAEQVPHSYRQAVMTPALGRQKVLDADVAPVNSVRKTYKEAFAQRVSSKIKPAVITDPGSSSKPRATMEFKFAKVSAPAALMSLVPRSR